MPLTGFNDGRKRFKNPITGRWVLFASTTHLRLCRKMRKGELPKKSIPPCPVLKTQGRKKGTKVKGGKVVIEDAPETIPIKIKEAPKTLKVKIKKAPKTVKNKIKKEKPKREVNPMAQAAAFAGTQRKTQAINRMNKGRIGIELKKRKPLKKTKPELPPKPTRRLTTEGQIARGMARRYGFSFSPHNI